VEPNQDWWLQAKEQSLERKAQRASQNTSAAIGDTFLVVTEGTVTEPVYFEFVRSGLKLSRVQVTVTPGDHPEKLVSVLVSTDTNHICKPLKIICLQMDARVGIERFMLCFPKEFSHQTAASQGYSATTRPLPIPTRLPLLN